jgi:hypothetical protein
MQDIGISWFVWTSTHSFLLFQILKTKSIEKIAIVLLKIFVDFGLPKILQLDNDPAFTGRVINDLYGKFGFQHHNVISYFLQQNRAVEHHVEKVKKMIFKTIHGNTTE